MTEPLQPQQVVPLDVAKVRDVLGNQVLEILRLQAEVEALTATIADLTKRLQEKGG